MGTNKEEYLSKKRAKELWDKNIINSFEIGTFKGLQQIHQYIFQDVFSFAGKIRNVNLAKGNFRFASLLFLENNLQIIEKMPENSFDEIVEKYVEMNVAHPFREGNGRATRIWLDLILKKNLGVCVDWQKIDKMEYLQAMERSVVNPLELKHLLKKALTKDIKNRDVYMKGIEKSYFYEEQYDYDIYDIK
ncbi:Fic family protein [Anaerococcus sp. AGMB09787]|uniref:protein adenylyltransferase Fic n=1 Tax=Anaerococcus sp. AGMB09787 TaxID=2922869 RepID=UPI001FAEC192|nr:Fic family protein [Anaerococcus sp. AGMB09787]